MRWLGFQSVMIGNKKIVTANVQENKIMCYKNSLLLKLSELFYCTTSLLLNQAVETYDFFYRKVLFVTKLNKLHL